VRALFLIGSDVLKKRAAKAALFFETAKQF